LGRDDLQCSRNKYKFGVDLGLSKLSRVLPEGLHFPYDFGFIPGTSGDDGDALDVVAITDTPSFVGCLMSVRLIGVIAAKQTGKRNTVRSDRFRGFASRPETLFGQGASVQKEPQNAKSKVATSPSA
jgi:hypothetical protein